MQSLAKAFRLDDEGWMRHANPWSVWTRVAILPLFVAAVWSRVWIGGWAMVPVAALIVWAWANPRAFPPPAAMESWASRGVLGERIWLNQTLVPIPRHHARIAALLAVLSGLGLFPLAWGLYTLSPSVTACGFVVTLGAKMWFIDRMVWLYEDMRAAPPDRPAGHATGQQGPPFR
ncbi:MAG: hypothetical protein HC844_15645 [Tabrizicola sp.]|nr:hypothetical protein [Tabrizicola sp.]